MLGIPLLDPRRSRALVLVGAALSAVSCARIEAPRAGGEGLTPTQIDVALGSRVLFSPGRLAPVAWSVGGGPGHGVIDLTGLYHAPYFAPEDSGATVVATSLVAGVDTSESARVTFLPLSPDTIDCWDAFQVPSGPSGAQNADQLPDVLLRVPPIYPPDARAAGISGTVLVQALVCRCGLVMRTSMQISIPALDGAAQEAIRQWVFTPAMFQHRPVACWVVVPVQFTLHAPPTVLAGRLRATRAGDGSLRLPGVDVAP